MMQPLDPIVMIPILLSYLLISAVSVIFLYKKKLSKKLSILILLAAVVVPGFILGLAAHPAFNLQQIFININTIFSKPVVPQQLLMMTVIMLVISGIFIVSTLFFGRIFCGYACPLGAAQEVIFKVRVADKPTKTKYKLDIPPKYTNIIRISIFALMVILALIWGLALFDVNPFSAFGVFTASNLTLLLIPLILLAIILIASVFTYRPWCRLLCPFGTMAWLTSRFSRFKIQRNENCTDCKLCEKICPTSEAYQDSKKAECYLCNLCVDNCPANALEFTKK